MRTVLVRDHVRAEIAAHAREAAPDECCGLLIGAGSVIDGCVRTRNVDPSPGSRYRIDPVEHIDLNRRLRGTTRGVAGCYHSHPHTPPEPSEADRAEAYYRDFIWVIVSLQKGAADMAAYEMTSGGLTPVRMVHMPSFIDSIRDEYQRYKALAEGAIAQMSDAELSAPGPAGGNSIATICWHLSGNLRSRFSDFLTSDGEKPWRKREEEFASRTVTRPELLEKLEQGWKVLFESLRTLGDGDVDRAVTIRGQQMTVQEALHRSVAHSSYHVGQIVYVAKAVRGPAWTSLSIPPGGTTSYNENPTLDRAGGHAAAVTKNGDAAT